MVESGWPYVWAAYALTIVALAALALMVSLSLRHWSALARAIEKDALK